MMKRLILFIMILLGAAGVQAQSKGTLKDPRDNQVYKTVQIGNRIWMAENLNFKAENSFCYDKDSANCHQYGRLYVYDNAMNACPTGWHLPSDEEWTAMTDVLGGEEQAGLKMVSVDAKDSKTASYAKINSSGFTALAGGYRNNKNLFVMIGKYGGWWTSTEYSKTDARSRLIYMATTTFYSHFDKKNCAFSVRCVKN